MIKERHYARHLTVSQQVFDMITKDCVNSFITAHPEFKGKKITQNHIIEQIALFYLKW